MHQPVEFGAQFLDVERLCDVVYRPEPRRLDRCLDGAILGEHDDRNLGIAHANPLDELQPSDLRDFQIRDDDVDRILVQDIERLLGGG